MVNVVNVTDRIQEIMHWKVFPNSNRCIDPLGNIRTSLPDVIAYSDIAKYLARNGILKIEGYTVDP